MISLLLVFLSQISLILGAPQTILCLIHTATPSHETRAKTILETWVQHCDDFLFFTDSKMNDSIPHIYYPLLNSRDHSWEKIRRVFKYVRDKITKKYDWYYRADDDTYALMHNMRTLLDNYSPTKHHYLGLQWNFFTPRGFNDGSSYILSRPTMEAFNEVMLDPDRCPDHHRAEEDQELAKCLAHMEIYPEDIRDEMGSERIQHFHPLEQLTIYKDTFNRRLAYYPAMKEDENFSDKMISFHHVSPYEMRLMDYIFYRLDKP
ncbi:N-acetylgalactosaminide beta-1,3-galactosyltransferase [Caenorhabditis elegans]|uniref:N-acetylgalactosaminide beta-1,3-galactosyltransferase n=1 Tax=Caenorhabditis elegans TaxID=6239 RepID=G5ECT3_CAEEL|nr:Glycoprotein-N-acetylgalactosamine 3-beta-galactosyltransferase 1 [Caenorhabditis elegans]NP_499857.3 Glycoprotein-N-acetylgalactosamine 3-beta-galactosyltransferase 1 [Caenorhabditis elegans]CCD68253.1 Glycoprotein-N-acetylgalactosamine 3-beta-galactosyltransferase 1 [Caenorhabditis elegans]CCD68257.1 Glycoprotein-N-acetylgalactosamine 3-beta-galactosyltransferase 1 [Caenorhabditis elegans]|eukprot:NP_499851.3 Glycoprotein-N-acetylgalactosamine 3-beta-galactosyltransferase 1 [Caenorhabditis elegans]